MLQVHISIGRGLHIPLARWLFSCMCFLFFSRPDMCWCVRRALGPPGLVHIMDGRQPCHKHMHRPGVPYRCDIPMFHIPLEDREWISCPLMFLCLPLCKFVVLGRNLLFVAFPYVRFGQYATLLVCCHPNTMQYYAILCIMH